MKSLASSINRIWQRLPLTMTKTTTNVTRWLPRFQRCSVQRLLVSVFAVALILFLFTMPYDQYYSNIAASVGARQRRALELSSRRRARLSLAANQQQKQQLFQQLRQRSGGNENNFSSSFFIEDERRAAAEFLNDVNFVDVESGESSSTDDSSNGQCRRPVLRNSHIADFDTKKLVQQLTRLNNDGGRGVWSEFLEQGYEERLTRDPLPIRIILLPFSHSDPGWLKTLVAYYEDNTGPTLDNMVEQLEQKPNMKFIWSEISFFSMWWSRITYDKKQRVRALLARGQLEFVNGGFVMTDEAAANLYAIVHQFVTGHRFLQDNLNVTVKHGWSIDPFGYSATLPYLYTQLGFRTNYIQRVHYNIKEHLARNRALQFLWQQHWADSSDGGDKNTAMWTYMSPNFLYTVRESCGPHREVCREFDFKTSVGEWYHARNEPITASNIQQKAQLLTEEYARMASLFDHKVYLHLLGDDFRYDKLDEWNQQYNNYELLRNYINARNSSFNMLIEWGTLDTYYTRVKQNYAKLSEFKAQQQQQSNNADRTTSYAEQPQLPRLQGDFHAYADKYSEYWSGYYSTRPFVKRLSRELAWRLRSAEIIATQAALVAPHTQAQRIEPEDEWRLKLASEALGLFQHHDAITGTAKSHVMNDYASRLLAGLDAAALVITNSARRLLEHASPGEVIGPDDITIDYQRPDVNSLPQKFLLDIRRNRVERVMIMNALARPRTALVKIHCNSFDVEVMNATGHKLDFQINPVWTGVDTISSDAFEILFFARLPALSLIPFTVQQRTISSINSFPQENDQKYSNNNSSNMPDEVVRARMVSIAVSNAKLNNKYFTQHSFPDAAENNATISLENDFLKLNFDTTSGMLQSYVLLKTSIPTAASGMQPRSRAARIALLKYGTARSGAYLFLPTGDAYPLVQQPLIVRVIRGPLVSQVDVVYPENIIHKVRLQHSSQSSASIHGAYIDIENIFNINGMNNNELIMRITSDIYAEAPSSSSLPNNEDKNNEIINNRKKRRRRKRSLPVVQEEPQQQQPAAAAAPPPKLRRPFAVQQKNTIEASRPEPVAAQPQSQPPPVQYEQQQPLQRLPPPPYQSSSSSSSKVIVSNFGTAVSAPPIITANQPPPSFIVQPVMAEAAPVSSGGANYNNPSSYAAGADTYNSNILRPATQNAPRADPRALYTDWYADANGFQMMPRRTSRTLPIQANYYPITTQAYIEANGRRMTLHVSEAHGAASLQPGELEVMLDRRLNQDDGRGMGEPVLDSRATQQFMRLVFEDIDDDAGKKSPAVVVSNPTLLGHLVNQDLNNPVELLLISGSLGGGAAPFSPGGAAVVGTRSSLSSSSTNNNNNNSLRALHLARRPLACDTHLLMMRPLGSSSSSSTSAKTLTRSSRGGGGGFVTGRSSFGIMLHQYGVQCTANNSFTRELVQNECNADGDDNDVRLQNNNNNVHNVLPATLDRRSKKFTLQPSAINFITPDESPQLYAGAAASQINLVNASSSSSSSSIKAMNLAAFVLRL